VTLIIKSGVLVKRKIQCEVSAYLHKLKETMRGATCKFYPESVLERLIPIVTDYTIQESMCKGETMIHMLCMPMENLLERLQDFALFDWKHGIYNI